MAPQTLVVLLGIASSITLLTSALSVHRPRLLMFGIITSLLVAVQYSLVGSYTALGTLIVGLFWTSLTLLSLKLPALESKTKYLIPVFMLAHIISFSLLADWGNMQWVNFIPLVGGLGGTLAISFKDVTYTKAVLIVLGAGWLIYQFNVSMYSQMVGESLNLVANSVALGALIRAKMKGIPNEAMEDLDTQFIHTVTGAVTLPNVMTTSIMLPNGGKVKRPAEGVHSSSVQYSRRLAEHDRELQKQRDRIRS